MPVKKKDIYANVAQQTPGCFLRAYLWEVLGWRMVVLRLCLRDNQRAATDHSSVHPLTVFLPKSHL